MTDRQVRRTRSSSLTDQQVWADDATAHRIGDLARQVREELRGVNSPGRRDDLRKWAERIIREERP